MSLESDIIRIEAALAAMDSDPDTMPGQWEACTLPLDHIDREFVEACHPDAIRRLVSIAKTAEQLALVLDGTIRWVDDSYPYAKRIVGVARDTLDAYRAAKEQKT